MALTLYLLNQSIFRGDYSINVSLKAINRWPKCQGSRVAREGKGGKQEHAEPLFFLLCTVLLS